MSNTRVQGVGSSKRPPAVPQESKSLIWDPAALFMGQSSKRSAESLQGFVSSIMMARTHIQYWLGQLLLL